MKTISTALAAHLAGELVTTATLWKVSLQNGTILGFTDHDADIVWSGLTYAAATGFNRSAITAAGDLSVDNLEVMGFLTSPSIVEADLMGGKWDYARVDVYLCNWADLTQGTLYLRTGYIGKITELRQAWKAEVRGIAQLLSQRIGELYQPTCRAYLGDSRCTVSLTSFTKTGTVQSVLSNRIINDSTRTEAGPPGGVAISAITNANPCVITATAHGLITNQQASIGGLTAGPVALNGGTWYVTVINANQISIPVDTTNTLTYPAYVSGGVLSPIGAGYFDGGLLTFNTGACAGFSMEIKSYVPGQITLALPMGYQVSVGDTYTAIAGCDHQRSTCVNKFSNIANFRGEPDLPGLDRLMKVTTF